MSEIKNSLFVITGAGSGIGRALSILAISEGAKVVASDVNEKGLDETIALTNGKAEKYLLDVANHEEIKSFAAAIIQKYPNDTIILVNNAGVGLASGTFSETPLDDFEWLMNINLYGANKFCVFCGKVWCKRFYRCIESRTLKNQRKGFVCTSRWN